MKEEGGTWCGPVVLLVEIAEDYEAAPELRERAAYHAELETKYRWAARYPWLFAPAETPFIPDDRNRPPEWLRAKAEAYKSLESVRRYHAKLAEEQGQREQAASFICGAEEDASRAADYDQRAKRVRGGSLSKVSRGGEPEA
jgi:hypothetical protein